MKEPTETVPVSVLFTFSVLVMALGEFLEEFCMMHSEYLEMDIYICLLRASKIFCITLAASDQFVF